VARRGRACGFTLLEVMCAFAILALLTSLITEICQKANRQGDEAADLRDLREAADTVFRRLCYEDGVHPDGMRASLESFYAEWANLSRRERNRWRDYELEFTRRARTAAGESKDGDAEPIVGDSSGSSGSRSSSSGTSGRGTGTGTGTNSGDAVDEEDTSVKLVQLTLKIFHREEPGEALIVLQTYLPPQGSTEGGGGTEAPR
jgi:prepilin-type N-terminal cleavage/methylation domain-containing protein